jgi:hypothetical protein
LRRVPAPRMNLSPTLGRARLPPSRQPPREGEAPAEPRVETNGCYCGVWVDLFHHGIHGIHGNTTERLSRCLRVPTVVVHERSRPWWGEAPAEPRDSAAWQGFGSAGASPSQRQAFGSAGASPSQKAGVRLSGSFALPKGQQRGKAICRRVPDFALIHKKRGLLFAAPFKVHNCRRQPAIGVIRHCPE